MTFSRAEALADVLMVVPLTFFGAFVQPRWRWQEWTTYAFVGSSATEILQGVLLPQRQAAFSDIVANTSGALVGALLGAVVVKRLRSRGRPRDPAAFHAP